MSNARLLAAIELASLHKCHIFPLVGKKPTKGSQGYKDATTDLRKITEWWKNHPERNIGIATGGKSGFFALDIDPRHLGDESLHMLEDKFGMLPETVSVKTGANGSHYYFKMPKGRNLKFKNSIRPGIDIKANGGYVVAPPSVHPETGREYEWDNPIDEHDIAEAPEWLLQLVSGHNEESAKNEQADVINEGKRNNVLCSMAGGLRRLGLNLEEIKHSLIKINTIRCKPPLLENEVNKIVESICNYPAGNISSEPDRVSIIPFSNIKTEEIDWLWPNRIARGKVTLLQGDPGLGKSLLTIDIASRVSRGALWPDNYTSADQGDVFILSAEDDASDTIKPRIEAAGGDCNRIHSVRPDGFSIDSDLDQLVSTNVQEKPHLLIIDPISAYLGKADSHKSEDVRRIMTRLSTFSEAYRIAILVVTHLNKSPGLKAAYRTMGSISFVAAARSSWLIATDPDDASSRLMVQAKTNLTGKVGGLRFRFTDRKTPRLEWDSEVIDIRPDDLLAGESKDRVNKKSVAKNFLENYLSNGPQKSTDVIQAAKSDGISEKTLQRAAKEIGVQNGRNGFGKGSFCYWELPIDGRKSA